MKLADALGSLLLGLLAGCGSDADGSGGSGGSTGQGGGGGGGGATGCAVEAAPEVADVSGRFGLLLVGSQLVQAQGFANPFTNRIISVLLADMTQTGDAVTLSAAYCDHYSEDPDGLVKALIPVAYRDSLAPVTRAGTFAEGPSGRRLLIDSLTEIAGADLADPAEALPTDPTDARLVDQDMDSKPGMTIQLTGFVDGEVYVVERKITALDGVAVSADRIEGLMSFSSEQSLLGSDPADLQQQVAASQRLPDPETCNSYFRMVRVADTMDCATLRAQGAALFE